MKEQAKSAIKLLEALTERAKELTCLYAIEEILNEPEASIDQVCDAIVRAIPPGWQFPEICVATIALEGREYSTAGFGETPWKLSADIVQQDHVSGRISVYYTREMPKADVGPFLREEKKLIETIADRLSYFLTYKRMAHLFQEWQAAGRDLSESHKGDWEAVLDLIRQTDRALFIRISNKMLNHLCWSGIEEAETLRRAHMLKSRGGGDYVGGETNSLSAGGLLDFSTEFTERIFRVAGERLSGDEILSRIQMWIQEDKLSAVLQTVHRRLPLLEISNALRRYFFAAHEETADRYPIAKGLKVFLIERLLSEQLQYINAARKHLDIEDLHQLLQRVIVAPESQGRLGSKSAGFFLASQILRRTKEGRGTALRFGVPKTWYISSDMMLYFMRYNNVDEIIGQKYKQLERVRLEYPHVVEMFRQSTFPPELMNGLSAALEDLGDTPLVVRSSSLLEERMRCSFAGKYKSVFVGNQGTMTQRLAELMRAVAEVYASNFGPDPIEYRQKRRLEDFSEQMGVMIQEVVGARVGSYFFPAYSGVALSRNDFRGSPHLKAEDGVVRIIPGLGTRAMERTGQERPVHIVPGCPSFRARKSVEDAVRRAPKKIDVINLETNGLETVELQLLLKDYGDEYPGVERVVSVYEEGEIRPRERRELRFGEDHLVATFDGLATRSPFAPQIRRLLETLEEKLGGPVEVEFASDGEEIYLLQCRPRSFVAAACPAPIPKNVPMDKIVFSANRYVSNGRVSDITHIVYVDPAACDALEDASHHEAVEQAVRRLNQMLPKRQFIIMGPGSRCARGNGGGGRAIGYSDISNAAVLVEMVKTGEEDEEALCLGVDLLDDFLESDVRYLPIFPEDGRTRFNELFLRRSPNLLAEILPEYAFLADAVRVIDVAGATGGKLMQILMNADLDEAVGILTDREEKIGYLETGKPLEDGHPESYWRWRRRMAEQVASQLDPDRFGVVGFYLFGSTKNGTAGPASDIDLLVHFKGTEAQREDLRIWLEGWSLCLDEINYLQTGYRSGGLLDVHLVTDEDIARRTSYAVKINAVTDAAHPLSMKASSDRGQPGKETTGPFRRQGVN